MSDYRDAGQSLIQSGDVPFVNQYGNSPLRPTGVVAPTGASDGTPDPGGGGSPTLSLSAYVLNFSSKTGGANPPSQTIQLTNSGTGTLDFTVGSTPDWLVITPTSGAAPSTLTVSILNTGLTAGYRGAFVTITASGAAGSPAELDVFLTVEADWDLPVVEAINKKAWLGYFKTSTFRGEYTTTACTGTANACVVSLGDMGDNPEAIGWATRQRNAASQIAALGGKIFIGPDEREILNMKGQWDQVGGIFTAMEATTPDPPAVEAAIAQAQGIIRREGLQNRIFVTYIDSNYISTLTKWISGMDWLMLGVYLPYISSSESADAVRGRAATIISSSMAKIIPLMPAGKRVVLAAQAYARQTWDPITLEYLQKVYPDALRAYSQISGIFWFAYERNGDGVDGHPTLIPWHKATKQAILGTPDLEVPSSGPTGTLEVCNTTTISGVAWDPDYPDQSAIVQIFDGPGVLGVNTNRIGQLATNAATRAFSMATPASVLDGAAHNIYAYVLSKSVWYQALLANSPQTIQLVGGSPGMTVSGRSFYKSGSLFIWKGVTAFMAIKILLDGGSMNTKLDYWQGKGITNIRVFGMIGGESIWTGWGFNPSSAGYYAAWNTLLTACASRNIVVEACLMADTSVIPGYDNYTGKLAFVKQFAATLASHKNFVVELCNEPWIPYNGNNTTTEQWATLMTEYLKIDPTRVITIGAPNGDSDTGFNISPTKYLAIHSDRDSRWNWVIGLFDPANPVVSQSTLPCVDNEPINSTSASSSQVDPDPARWYAYGLGCQLRQLSSTYHYGAGKFTDLPTGAALTCLDSWRNGRNDVSWNWGGTYFHGTYPTSSISPFNSNGQLLTMGRVNGNNAVALVVANAEWSPSFRPGWGGTLTRLVDDFDDGNTAFFYTLSYS